MLVKQLKYFFECAAYGLAVAIVVHGMISISSRMITGVWLDEGGIYRYAFWASIAMFGSLYAFFDNLNKQVSGIKWYHYQYARYILISMFVVFPVMGWITYEVAYSNPLKMTVIQERQPLFVLESDGSIQNKYVLKLVNATDKDVYVNFSAVSEMKGQAIIGAEQPLLMRHGKLTQYTIFITEPKNQVTQKITDIKFQVQNIEAATMQAKYKTVFNGPFE
jgi:IG-like fold at C-terminal of FixG, putative oxidoreductase